MWDAAGPEHTQVPVLFRAELCQYVDRVPVTELSIPLRDFYGSFIMLEY